MDIQYDHTAIRRHREKRKWSLTVLSARTGLTIRTLGYIEKGHSDPKATSLAKIASAYGVSVNTFFRRVQAEAQAA